MSIDTGSPLGALRDIDDDVDDSTTQVTSEASSSAAEFNAQLTPDAPEIRTPEPGDVFLNYGYSADVGQAKHAVVRELRGSDEEVISKLKSTNTDRYYIILEDTILRRAVERIGDFEPATTPDLLSSLLIGDRGLLFANILLATYGPHKDYDEVMCPHCKELSDIQLDWFDLLDVRAMKTEEPTVTITVGKGTKKEREITLRFPTGLDQMTVYSQDAELTQSEVNSQMLSRVLVSDSIPDKLKFVRELSIPDRKKLIQAIDKNAPSVGFKECEVPCPTCNQSMSWTFSWADLLLG